MVSLLSLRPLVAVALVLTMALAVACGGDDGGRARDDAVSGVGGGAAPEAPGEPRASGDYDAPGDDSSGSDGGALASSLDRKIIRTATLTLSVDSVSQKFEDVGNIATSAGGFVASSTFGNTGEDATASITIRVPASEYDSTLRQLRRIGTVDEESSNANDVTEQVTDLESRLRNLVATEQRYLEFLERADNINDVLAVQDRINMTRAEIEQVQGRLQLLANQVDLATITAHLVPVAAPADDGGVSNPLEVASEAFEASIAVLIGIATVAIAVLAFSWWLAPLAAAGFYFGRRQLREMRDRQPPAQGPA